MGCERGRVDDAFVKRGYMACGEWVRGRKSWHRLRWKLEACSAVVCDGGPRDYRGVYGSRSLIRPVRQTRMGGKRGGTVRVTSNSRNGSSRSSCHALRRLSLFDFEEDTPAREQHHRTIHRLG